MVSRNPFAIGERDAAQPPTSSFDPLCRDIVLEGHAELPRQLFESAGQCRYAALYRPDALRLDMGNQHQRGWREKGG
jgi:hypothetical protein